MIPNKEKSIDILNKYIIRNPNLDHCYMVAYGMQGVAKYYDLNKEEQDYWFVVGLLHDIDIEKFSGDISEHCLVGEKILLEENVDQQVIDDIKSHNVVLNIGRNTTLRKALYSTDVLTGIIRAYVLIRPDKDVKQTKVKSILKKIKDKTFASNINRDQIRLCETSLNIELNKFIEVVLNEIKDNYSI
jgi:putative nucleotidyltransferase with HDIG domain